MVVLILLVKDMLSSGSPRTRFAPYLQTFLLQNSGKMMDLCLFYISNFIAAVNIDAIVVYF